MNSVQLVGRLTKDPEFRQTKGGTEVCRYSMAVPRPVKREGEPNADFIQIICFGKTATFASEYLKKGMKVGITGSISTGSYKGKDGKTVYTFEVIAGSHEFMEKKEDNSKEASDPYEDAPWR